MTESIDGRATPGKDGKLRCPWANASDDYMVYHDTEWGVPVHDEQAIFERIMLEAFQSGLSWITILRKREAFREVFHGFDPDVIAQFDETDIQSLMNEPRIVRNRRKIEAAITNARATIELRNNGGLAELVWSYAPEQQPLPRTTNDVPAFTPESVALSRALKKAGFAFVGPTTCYSSMQAIGVVNDHLVDCHCRNAT